MWSQCTDLFLGRAPFKYEIRSATTITARILGLHEVDKHLELKEQEDRIIKLSKNGFPTYIYCSSDDTMQCGKTCHGIGVSGKKKDGEPCFHLLSVSSPVSKDAKGCAKTNLYQIKRHMSPMVYSHIGGGATDNDPTAVNEQCSTFDGIIDELKELSQDSMNDSFLSSFINGVEWKSIVLTDFFHIGNLAMTHASIGAFGPTIRSNDDAQHKQVHHCQVIQCMANLRKHDPLYQDHMDEVMKDTDYKIIVKAPRERKQRWNSNQRQSRYIISTMDKKTKDGVPSLIAWAKRIEQYSTSLPSQIASHLSSLLLKPEIILSLLFEGEIGIYFEITSLWHSQPGETNCRNNFRMLELHSFIFEFVMPWWSKATKDLKSVLPKTYSYWKSNFKDQKKNNAQLKWNQLCQGVQHGYNQILKMLKLLLSPPLIFLVILDVEEGMPFLRALLKCVIVHGIELSPEK